LSMEAETFVKGITMIRECFNLNPDTTVLKTWAMLLQDVGDRDFIEAVVHICRHVQRLDKDVNVAALIRNQIQAQKNLSGDEAWQEVLKALSRVGRYRKPEFPERPALQEAIESVGWQAICDCENSKMGVMRAQFLKAYEACQGRKRMNESLELASGPVRNLLKGVGKRIIKRGSNETSH
jgi:hypothetical protein